MNSTAAVAAGTRDRTFVQESLTGRSEGNAGASASTASELPATLVERLQYLHNVTCKDRDVADLPSGRSRAHDARPDSTDGFLLQCKLSMQRPVDAAANASSLQELEQRKSPAAHADRRPPACNALCSLAPALCLLGPPFARASRWPSTSLSPPKAEE